MDLSGLWSTATFLKLLFIFCLWPVWGPIAKDMWHEIQGALTADDADPSERPRRVEPSMDPWLNVPLAEHRRQRQQGPSASRTPSAQTEENAPRRGSSSSFRTVRRRGF